MSSTPTGVVRALTLLYSFIQRRRKDISDWQAETQDGHGFPRRLKTEITYQLSGQWGGFFDAVQDYCTEIAEEIERQESGSARLIWYAPLVGRRLD